MGNFKFFNQKLGQLTNCFLLGQIETPTTDGCENYSLFKLNTRLQFVLYQYLYILVF